MPILFKKDFAECTLYVWHIDESVQEMEEMVDRDTITSEYNSITSVKRRQEWLASKILYKHINPNDRILYNEIGAPYINDAHISISHSQDKIAILYSKKYICGVDIESPNRNFKRVATRFLSKVEQQLSSKVSTDSNVDQNRIYAYLWCAKEAIYKTLGRTDVEFDEDIIIYTFNKDLTHCKARSFNKEQDVTFLMVEDMIVAITLTK